MMIKFCSKFPKKNLIAYRELSTLVKHHNESNEYVEEAVYPPIEDISTRKKKERQRLEWHEKIKQVGTIEEKLIEINMPRYYGYKSFMLSENSYPYNTLPLFQYVTNTEFVKTESHSKEGEGVKNLEGLLKVIRADIEEALEFELDGYQ